MPHKLTVRTNGQTLTVKSSVSHWTTEALARTASGTNDVESTTTTTITSDYDLWFADTATTATITVKQIDGTTLLADTYQVGPGYGPRVLNPISDAYQRAGDLIAGRLTLAPAGAVAETYSRMGATVANSPLLSSGILHLTAIEIPQGTVVSQITYGSATTAANTPTNYWFALYNSDLTLCAQTADQTSTAWAANTFKSLSLTAPYTTTKSGRHYVGIMVAAATPPTLWGVATNFWVTNIAPISNGSSTTGLTTTAPATAAALTAQTNTPYAYLS